MKMNKLIHNTLQKKKNKNIINHYAKHAIVFKNGNSISKLNRN